MHQASNLDRLVYRLERLFEYCQHARAAVMGRDSHDFWLDRIQKLNPWFQSLGIGISFMQTTDKTHHRRIELCLGMRQQRIQSHMSAPGDDGNSAVLNIDYQCLFHALRNSQPGRKRGKLGNNPRPRIGATLIQFGIFLIAYSFYAACSSDSR